MIHLNELVDRVRKIVGGDESVLQEQDILKILHEFINFELPSYVEETISEIEEDLRLEKPHNAYPIKDAIEILSVSIDKHCVVIEKQKERFIDKWNFWLDQRREGIPEEAVFFEDNLHFAPFPDQDYLCRIRKKLLPIDYLKTQKGSEKFASLITLGTARKVFLNQGRFESRQQLEPFLQEQVRIVNRIHTKEDMDKKIHTIFDI